jgi:quercetin dioxygenase-like cupin family protein
MRMKLPVLLLTAALLLSGVAAPADAREAGIADGVHSETLLKETLGDDPTREVVSQTYEFPAGAVLPWHIHPHAHEVVYVLSGDFVLEVEGDGEKPVPAGASLYLAPNKVHRGRNVGKEPVKLFVIRIKPKDKPLTEEVDR